VRVSQRKLEVRVLEHENDYNCVPMRILSLLFYYITVVDIIITL